MKRATPILMLILLAGCAGREPATPVAESDSPAQAECRAEARSAPDVQALSRRVLIGQPASEYNMRRERQTAEAAAFTACLQRRGLSRGGGVEPLRRPGF